MKQLFALLASGTFVILLLIFLHPVATETTQTNKPQIAATIFPIYDITRNITGDRVDVALILPPGASPHTFEPTPSSIRELQGSDVVFAIGHGLDDWSDSIVLSVGSDKTIVDKTINLRTPSIQEDNEAGDGFDPHYWLTVPNAIIISQNIAADLETRYPEYANEFDANLQSYIAELETENAKIEGILSQVENKQIITLHDAWYYFADAYQLNIVGTFEPTAGREPTPQYLADLTDALETSGSKTLFSEPQLSTSSIQSFADDNGLTIVSLDPIGGSAERESYIDLMTYNAETIAQNQ